MLFRLFSCYVPVNLTNGARNFPVLRTKIVSQKEDDLLGNENVRFARLLLTFKPLMNKLINLISIFLFNHLHKYIHIYK